ncbi:TonB-dependent receptor [Acidicapsa acidisoli]|uniref:TonB-dependent receptor n=1 Tax=Acidicapsa acidisoli TaxID=1615681 RepID=UPI0021E0022B|nr:TonB-dependent receptor [Acidicapsa acidisoli]
MTITYWRRSVAGSLFALVTLLVSLAPAFAQQTLGSINGTVLDTSGASVPDATISVTNSQIDLTRTARSQANGFFQIFNLPIGTYKVTITHDGFDTTDLSGVTVQEAHATTVNGTLKVGKVSESVEVTANPLLNATDATNGYTLDAAEIEETPLATGSFTQLAVLAPGVNAELLSGVGTNAGLGNQPIWANGQRDTSNTFQVNGVDVTNLFNGKSSSQDTSQRYNFNIGEGSNTAGSIQNGTSVYGSNGNGMPSPPPDFLQELRVNTSMYDAQQGATSGAQIDANTRTGSNKWHGSAFGTRATNVFNAAPFFFKLANIQGTLPNALVNPELHRDTIGGTVGGPLWKDKLFFFGAYQNLHTSDQSTGLSQFDVPYGLTDDRSSAGILNALNSYYTASGAATVSSYNIDPIAMALLNAKLPNGQYMIPSVQNNDPALVTGNLPNVTLIGTTLFNAQQATAAIDYNATATDHVSLKYYYQHDPYSAPYTASKTGGFPENEDSGSQVAAISNTIAIGPRINWEQRLGFARIKVYSNFQQQVTDSGSGGPTFGINFPNATGLPGMTFDDFAYKNKNSSITAGPASDFINDGYFQNRLNPSSNVIFAIGKHTLVAGGGDSYTQLNIRNLRTGLGSVTFSNFPQFLSGVVHSSSVLDSISAQGQNLSNRYYRSNEASGYVQDKYQVLSNLSITAGVRYDYHGAFTEKYGNIFNFDPSLYNVSGSTVTSGSSATGTSTGFTVNNAGFVVAGNNKYYPTKGVSDSTQTGRQWGISPRVGFAWSPKMNGGRVVISGGAGVYYDRGELFNYLSQPAGGGIGGPFGATEAPPLAAAYSGNGTLENPLGSVTVLPPNANPAFFNTQLQTILQGNLANCGAVNNQATFGSGCVSPFYFGAYARDNKLPYSTNYNLKFQWQPLNDLSVSLGYTGNRGFHGVMPIPFNQPQIATPSSPVNGEQYSYGYEVLNASAPPVDSYGDLPAISTEPWDTLDGGNTDFRTPYVGYSPSAALFKAEGNSAYDALETHLEKRISHGLQAGVSYTWSHSLDEQSDIGLFFTGSNPNNIRSSYASSDFDRTNVFSANFLAAVPNVAKDHSLLSYATNGWTLSGIVILQSGEPYSLYEFYGAVASIYYGNFPNLLNPVLGIKNPGNPHAALTGHSGAGRSGLNYIPTIDPSQLAINYLNPGQDGIPPCTSSEPCDGYETDYAPGNQRNIFRQAAQKRADISLRKTFHIWENLSAQYEFNVFNLTNTTSLDIPQDSAQIGQAFVGSTANYGQVTAATSSSVNSIRSQLYVLPQQTGSGPSTVVSNTNFGSVTGTIGSARIITMGLHITY